MTDTAYSQATPSSGLGGPATIADGADVNAGATTDAANTTGAAGTLSGKLRGLLTIVVDAWNQTVHALRVVQTNIAGVATQAVDVAVDATAGGITVLAANAARKSAVVQNVGAANMRVTYDGSAPTITNGLQLAPGASVVLRMPYCETAAVKAIREGAVSTTASVVETV